MSSHIGGLFRAEALGYEIQASGKGTPYQVVTASVYEKAINPDEEKGAYKPLVDEQGNPAPEVVEMAYPLTEKTLGGKALAGFWRVADYDPVEKGLDDLMDGKVPLAGRRFLVRCKASDDGSEMWWMMWAIGRPKTTKATQEAVEDAKARLNQTLAAMRGEVADVPAF